MGEIKIINGDQANIVVLMLKRIIEKNLKDEDVLNSINRLNAAVVIQCGKTKATIYFKDEDILLQNGEVKNPSACVEGSLKDFLNLGTGGNFIMPIITRRLKIKGNILALIPLIKIFKIRAEMKE